MGAHQRTCEEFVDCRHGLDDAVWAHRAHHLRHHRTAAGSVLTDDVVSDQPPGRMGSGTAMIRSRAGCA
jgi:hypothetical protein